jgi:NAD(P)-dependent dehydrogenase (short-subunit alcohol dehydrogenase family)
VLLDMNRQTLKALEAELKEYGCETSCFVCDVSNEDSVNDCVKDAIAKFGKIDVLINNAGLWRTNELFEETTTEKWNKFININVMGVVHCTKAVLPMMRENKYGRIVNIASVAGVYGNARMVVYSATKGALISMTKALAKEVVEHGILVNSVSPGTVSPSENSDIDYTKLSEMCYAGRTGSGKENADLICFLASEENGYIVGQNIIIDGCRKRI